MDVDIDGKIEDILSEIEIVEAEIVSATEKSRQLLDTIYAISAKIQEARYLQDRYNELRSHYIPDFKRLRYITTGRASLRDELDRIV